LVHKSLQQPDLLLGIPKMIAAMIFCLTTLLVYLFGFGFTFVSVILYVPCRIISKDDPLLLTMALGSLFEMDELEG
ncbi:MAG: VirB3 family type IV secretion system protein, partial [Lachnospiraceae bacterium]|nr:VirB3 family type IV secretion system protein [Lachnospiraceae bacterium]